jgi:hypothetical protein
VFVAFPAKDAHAKGAFCDRVQSDLLLVDGMKDDWESLRRNAYGSGRDASLDLRCAYDSKQLYILLDVQDERLVRTKKADAKSEDRISLSLGVGNSRTVMISLLPGSLRAPRKALVLPSFVELEDSLQPNGFSVELSLPLAKVKGWTPTLPYLSGSVLFHDVDAPKKRAESVIGLKGKMHFSEAADTYRAFMRAAGIKNSDVKLDRLVDVDPGAGLERVIIGGRVIGILGTSYHYMGLPIASASDLLSAHVADFDGSGRYGIVTELRQFGNGGSRDIVVVWFADGKGGFQQALTIETRKERQGHTLSNTWSLVPRNIHRSTKKRAKAERGKDILVQVGEAVGFDASSYREAPAPDAKSILLPWGDTQSAVYFFNGTVAYGGEEATNLPKPKGKSKASKKRRR